MDVNVKSVFWTAKHVVPVMERQGAGVIVITTSVAAFVGFPAHALYCASKAALEALVRCLAVDHAGKVRVVGLCPGTIDTPMLAATCAGWSKPKEELYAEVAHRVPVRRRGPCAARNLFIAARVAGLTWCSMPSASAMASARGTPSTSRKAQRASGEKPTTSWSPSWPWE